MSTETDWGRLTAAQLRDLAARDAIVILPVEATEQHGPHLPTSAAMSPPSTSSSAVADAVANPKLWSAPT